MTGLFMACVWFEIMAIIHTRSHAYVIISHYNRGFWPFTPLVLMFWVPVSQKMCCCYKDNSINLYLTLTLLMSYIYIWSTYS